MSLRTRFALAFFLIGAVVAGLVGILSYQAASARITDEIDQSLRTATTAVAAGQTDTLATAPAPVDGRRGGPPRNDSSQVGLRIAPDGTTTFLGGTPTALTVPDEARALATVTTAGLTDVSEQVVDHDPYRVLTTSLGDGRGALMVARNVDDSRRVLHGMAIEIAWVSAAVLLLAAGSGWFLARRITLRLVRLTRIAEEVSAHGALERTVPVEGRDEVGRLSASFNTMLGRLATARDAQDRLVQDAAHELRTPLTSLRTNASVLRRVSELSPQARDRLVDDVQGETRELSNLVEELVELALARRESEPEEDVDLAAVARHAAERVHRRTGRAVHIDGDGSVVRGRRQSLERAVGNLLENAAKFDDGADEIEVDVENGSITVRDHGPGIDAADAARVFDRFYRSDSARSLPGSGLGLAIVLDVAQSHGGTASVSHPDGGGAAVSFDVDRARLVPDAASGHAPGARVSYSVPSP